MSAGPGAFAAEGHADLALLALKELGWIRYCAGDLPGHRALALDVCERAEKRGDRMALIQSLGALGYVAAVQGRFGEADRHLRRSTDLARAAGKRYRHVWNLTMSGLALALAGRLAASRTTFERALHDPEAGDAVKVIAARIGKSYQSVYREIARNSKPDGSYQPWWAHNRAFERRQRPKPVKLDASPALRRLVVAKLALRWSPQQVSRYLHPTYPGDASMRCQPRRSIRACSLAGSARKGQAASGSSASSCGRPGRASPCAPMPNARPQTFPAGWRGG